MQLNKDIFFSVLFSGDLEISPCNENMQERILQFGEGNFLRAFFDYFIDILNEQGLFSGSIVVVQPIKQGLVGVLEAQEGLYTVLLRGLENQVPVVKKRLVTGISRSIDPYADYQKYMAQAKSESLRFVVSNTTESGITFSETDKLTDEPPSSFPGKVTVLLYERFKFFNGDKTKGFIFIPCELIDNSGDKLLETVLQCAENWRLPEAFINWIKEANYFTNTLVDRIVTGYPKDEAEELNKDLGYEDKLLTTGEIFRFFAIEAKGAAAAELSQAFPFKKAGIDAVITDNVTPYKLRKVRILNGAHTMSVLAAFLSGKETVGEMMDDPLFKAYLRKGIFKEIIPTLDLEKADLESFAESVFDRFANPYIKHYLLNIALNSISKFKVRVLPSIIEYHERTGQLPEVLTLSFAALIAFYKTDKANDDAEILAFFKAARAENDAASLVQSVCGRSDYWGTDLNSLPGFAEKVTGFLADIDKMGMKAVVEKVTADD